MAKAEYLVTGGAGFIGSNIVSELVARGRRVRVLDNLATGRMENLAGVTGRIDFVRGDIRDEKTVRRATTDIRFVLHLGALPSVARSVADPATSNDVNVKGTLNMLIAARDAGVERFVFSSSSSVYGNTPTLPKREDMFPMPLSPYAVQKLTGEYYCRMFYSLYGLNTFVIRYFNVFGPRQNPKSQYAAVVPLFIARIASSVPPVIHGDGRQSRDFTYVSDVVRANLCCCRAPLKAAGDVYNIACGGSTTINEVASLITKIAGANVRPVHVERRAGDVNASQGDSAKARRMLGWKPRVTFEDGLRKTVAFFAGKGV